MEIQITTPIPNSIPPRIFFSRSGLHSKYAPINGSTNSNTMKLIIKSSAEFFLLHLLAITLPPPLVYSLALPVSRYSC